MYHSTPTLVPATRHTTGQRGGSDGHEMGNDAGHIGLQEDQPEDGHRVVDSLHVGEDVGLIAFQPPLNQIIQKVSELRR